MKTRSDTALSTAAPNRPTLLNHARTWRRGRRVSTAPLWPWGSGFAIGIRLLLGGIDQFFQIAPEDLILGVLDVVEIVFSYGKDEDANGGERHAEAGDNGNPWQFHRASSIPTMRGRRAIAACCASKEIVAPLSTPTSALCASAHTPWAGHQPWRVHARALARATFTPVGPATASTTSRTEAVRCNSSNSKPPVLPRWEITRPARVRFCRALHRNCSGHSAAADSSERLTRAPGGRPARWIITRTA